MKKILIIKNASRLSLGLIRDVLNEHNNLMYEVIDLSKGDKFPSLQEYSALIILGGPNSANDNIPTILNEVAYIKEALDLGIPMLGVCLGLQVLVQAAGGEVVKNAAKEIGFYDNKNQPYQVSIRHETADPLLQGLPNSFNTFELHTESVVLTDSMTLLAEGSHSPNQIIRIAPKVYGFQYHVEMTLPMLENLIVTEPELQPYDKKKILHDFLTMQNQYLHTGRILIENFLKLAI